MNPYAARKDQRCISEIKDVFNNKGYFVINSLFNPRYLNNLLLEVYDVFYHQTQRLLPDEKLNLNDECLFKLFSKDLNQFMTCGKVAQQLPLLHQFGLGSNIMTWLNEIGLQKISISTKPVLFFHHRKLATKEIFYKIPQHRDSYSVRASSNAVVVWFPIAPIDKNMGTLEIVPGSHKMEKKLSHYEESFGIESGEFNFIPIDLEVGDVLFFHQDLIHRSGNNTSDKIRFAANFRYTDLLDEDWINRGYEYPYSYTVKV